MGRISSVRISKNVVMARRWILTGQVQGVGFRPFVFRLAEQQGLTGWVRNRLGVVELLAQGDATALKEFERALLHDTPALAQPEVLSSEPVTVSKLDTFTILESAIGGNANIHLPADLFACDACIRELNDPADRRYRYPFINCTQCGPRYTLIRELPYDRQNTSMTGFKLCPACAVEYNDPANRRFHAEPVACPDCGPSLTFRMRNSDIIQGDDAALAACVTALHDGRVIAMKGIGGYHLICDASSDQAIQHLRTSKPRSHKPLAVMFPAPEDNPLGQVNAAVELTPGEQQLLLSAQRPILLARKRHGARLSAHIAPGLKEAGVFLPYSPLHHLLLNDFGRPVVATSANLSGEPVLTDNREVEQRLSNIAEGFLHHNRPIERPADDPVLRIIGNVPRSIRLGRGNAPLEVKLPCKLKQPVLAVGGHMKNTICLAWDDRAVISPHIGEMRSPRSLKIFEQMIEDLQSLYQIQAEQVICDAHPGYASTRWAERCGLPVSKVFHHYAHASSVFEKTDSVDSCLVFTWDGVGYGNDGTLWGGEALMGQPGHWQRVATMRPFRLPGGERAGREPWRSAAGLCWETDTDWSGVPDDADLLHNAWSKHINAPVTTAVGRLFDAAAALTGVCNKASFEGQGPMMFEALVDTETSAIDMPLTRSESGLWVSDWSVLLPMLLNASISVAERAACFHASMAHCLLHQAKRLRDEHAINHIALSGGVFQNKILSEIAINILKNAGFNVHFPATIPVNDAGLSYGQVIEFASQHESSNGF
ncbi:MAG: carbamoyltransferase HypF [Gammaproteobacteria bacterium]